ncbi:MAG: zinc dependent phospholipase C family protein [Desulfohalobiaceae bacterium]
MIKVLLSIALAALILFGLAEPALAWGPGVHLNLCNQVLCRLDLVALSVARILERYPVAYVYGSLSADFLIGKGKSLSANHCHSWQSGFRLLQQIKEPELQAYAYGYLSHLAADVVAHNYYVPNMLQLGKGRGRLSHVYLELQADSKTRHCTQELKQIMDNSWKTADLYLQNVLHKSKFSFSLKKKIYQKSLALSRNNTCFSSLQLLDRHFPERSCEEYLEDMLQLSRQAVLDFLNQQDASQVCAYDPMGFEHLGLVRKHGRPNSGVLGDEHSRVFFLPSMNLLSM